MCDILLDIISRNDLAFWPDERHPILLQEINDILKLNDFVHKMCISLRVSIWTVSDRLHGHSSGPSVDELVL